MTETVSQTMNDTSDGKLLSVIVPFLNETEILDLFFKELMLHLEKLDMRFEVICIDNASTDDTYGQLLLWRQKHPEIKVIRFSRYFGKEMALTAGLDYAKGDAVILMDPDLQDPPAMMADFIAKWREGYDMVYATRCRSGIDTGLKTAMNTLFYKVFNVVSENSIPQRTGDFRLIDAKIVEVIRHIREKSRFLRSLTAWAGFKSTAILFDRPERIKGKSKSNWLFLWNYAVDAILSTTNRPLRIWSYIGLGISMLAILASLALVIRTVVFGRDVLGYASMMTAILFLGGFQLISIGVVAEYLGRVYREVQNRPLYVIDQSHGVDAGRLPPCPNEIRN